MNITQPIVIALLSLISTLVWAAREEQVFEVSVTVPTRSFYVLPSEPDWIHREQTLAWNPMNSALSTLRKDFDVQSAGAIEARLEQRPYLSNGRTSDDIALRVTFNNIELSHDPVPREVISAALAGQGIRTTLEIAPQQPYGGYRPGEYNGYVLLLFNAKMPEPHINRSTFPN